jgi:hypothetical protein
VIPCRSPQVRLGCREHATNDRLEAVSSGISESFATVTVGDCAGKVSVRMVCPAGRLTFGS